MRALATRGPGALGRARDPEGSRRPWRWGEREGQGAGARRLGFWWGGRTEGRREGVEAAAGDGRRRVRGWRKLGGEKVG